ncbi:MAG: GIY-YIG nuclease family protein [Bacillota bacterium]
MNLESHSTPKSVLKKKPQNMGVYQIQNRINNKIYVGSSLNLDSIFNKTKIQLESGKHQNKELQKEWTKFGPDNFIFTILERLKPEVYPDNYQEELENLEEFWLEKLEPYGERGYNKNKIKPKDWL